MEKIIKINVIRKYIIDIYIADVASLTEAASG